MGPVALHPGFPDRRAGREGQHGQLPGVQLTGRCLAPASPADLTGVQALGGCGDSCGPGENQLNRQAPSGTLSVPQIEEEQQVLGVPTLRSVPPPHALMSWSPKPALASLWFPGSPLPTLLVPIQGPQPFRCSSKPLS
jgi:hypothetical protein